MDSWFGNVAIPTDLTPTLFEEWVQEENIQTTETTQVGVTVTGVKTSWRYDLVGYQEEETSENPLKKEPSKPTKPFPKHLKLAEKDSYEEEKFKVPDSTDKDDEELEKITPSKTAAQLGH